MLASSMRLEGHKVLAATDGQEAVKRAEIENPDLIILDIHMPRLTGYEVCQKLKGKKKFKNTPIILISAQGEAKEIKAGLDAGAKVYLPKPFTIETLVSHVNSLLD
jgi:two-component system cell cycle response regulator